MYNKFITFGGNMLIKEKAKEFAIMAHEGQVRKSEPDKPMIVHPIAVAEILERYGYDDNVISAGYLHDVVEDTKYTIYDIKNHFGNDIADLVNSASEPDKTLSWEDRKLHTINEIKNMPLRNKLVVCSDKINNIEDLIRVLNLKGMDIFNSFKRDYKSQLWYFENIYNSLINNENVKDPIFIRLKEAIVNLKEEIKYQQYLEDNIFNNQNEKLSNLRKLHIKKNNLINLKQELLINKPYVIEFSGTPRTGKTSLINNLNDFFKKAGFITKRIPEFVSTTYYKNEIAPSNKDKTKFEINEIIIEEIVKNIDIERNSKSDILFIDRGIFDRLVWMHRSYIQKAVTEELYDNFINKYLIESKDKIDSLILTYAIEKEALKRDYIHSLSLEQRSFLNISNLEEYNRALVESEVLFEEISPNIHFIDTTFKTTDEVSFEVANNILNDIENYYILKKYRR